MLTTGLRKPAQLGVILLMIFGALMLWVGNPVIWLWVGSQLTTSQSASFGPYAVVAIGVLFSTIVTVMALARVNRLYERLTGTTPTVRVRLPWLKSLRDERGAPRTVTVFDVILVCTAVTGVTAAVIWFLFLAGSSLPGG
jgi:hypothetical protein